MTRAGWTRIGALLIVALTLAGAWAVLGSGPVRAQTIIFGYVNECPTSPLGGVTVSLIDAQGVNPSFNTTTDGGGLYTFTPKSGTYQLVFKLAGYFVNATATPFRFDGSQSLEKDACMDKMPDRTISFAVHVQDVGATPLGGAAVQLSDSSRDQVVASNTTNGAGDATLLIWVATLNLQVSRASFQPNETSVSTGTGSATVTLTNGVIVRGHAKTNVGPITKGVVAFLYNIGSVPLYQKIIVADVTGGTYTFSAIPGTYRLIVDGDGFAASVTPYTVPSSSPTGFEDRVLSPSPREVVTASFVLGRLDWNELTVYRNLTLNTDSSIPGLKIPFIRSVALQIDFTFGNGNGVVGGAEFLAFLNWLDDRGTFYVTTDTVFDVVGRTWNSTAHVPPTAVLSGNLLWINTSATYAVRGAAIPNGRTGYTVNLTMMGDTNGTVYRDQMDVVTFPRGYEMTAKVVTGPVTTTGWTEVTVDPGLSATASIRMTVQKSQGGVARAMVEGPAGKFFVLNGTLENYTAIISAHANITFSARQSTDPVGNINDANFTWRFDNVSNQNNPSWIRYGIEPTFNYTVGGRFQVNLTVVEAGLNLTHRDLIALADDTGPVAQIRTNRTAGNANDTTIRLPEGIEVKFNGGFSSDVIFNGSALPGKIFDGVTTPQSGYAWDFDGDHIVDSVEKAPKFTWSKPGEYTVNLTVTDSVAHKSVNATMTAIANDTTKPTPNFSILDPSADWASPPAKMIEGKTYFFNASKSTDNYDNSTAMNYTWTVPGPAEVAPFGKASSMRAIAAKTNGTFYGSNISIEWTVFNTSYTVILNVTDTGFGWNNPAKRNFAATNIIVVVQPDFTVRPNLQIVSNSLKINPANPEEGQAINVTIEVRDQPNTANATHLFARLSQTDPAPAVVLSESPQWYDANWVPFTGPVAIASGKTVHAVFTIHFPVQGTKSILISVNDTLEPYTVVDGANRQTGTIAVRQAGWVLPVIIGGSIGGLVAIGVLLRVRSKVRAGELKLAFPRLRKAPKEKKELEEEPEEEAEEEIEEKPKEKKRL